MSILCLYWYLSSGSFLALVILTLAALFIGYLIDPIPWEE